MDLVFCYSRARHDNFPTLGDSMRITYIDIEIENCRGIRKLSWAPGPALNCLIGPGDSSKTTILDAIELALTPRGYMLADGSDFFDVDVNKPIKITLTLAALPIEFTADDRYGLHLRGWDNAASKLEDEPGDGLEDALSVRVTINRYLLSIVRLLCYTERSRARDHD